MDDQREQLADGQEEVDVLRVVAKGPAREEAERLAEQIAAFPQACMRSDREALYRGMSTGLREALALELELGLRVIASGETLDGAKRFAAGEGKHDTF